MKLIWVLPIFFLSCMDSGFKVGQCVQKPDEMFVYKIISLDGKKAQFEAQNGGPLENSDVSSSMWTLTACN